MRNFNMNAIKDFWEDYRRESYHSCDRGRYRITV